MITRRKLLIALGLATFAHPLIAFGQQQGKVRRVGFLSQGSRPSTLDIGSLGALVLRLRELGYVEGQNLLIEWRFADGDYERLSALAAELVKLKVDVIVVSGAAAIGAVQKATANIPIVMGNVGDPVGAGFVKSLARPGGNITGFSNTSVDVSPKLLEMLLATGPGLTRVAVLLNPANSSNAAMLNNVQAAAPKAGARILPVEARTEQDIDRAFSAMAQQNAQAVIVMPDTVLVQHAHKIAQLAARHRLPSISASLYYAEAGGLISYGPNLADNLRRAATYVDKILKGARPGELPVEQSTKFEMIVNRKTAKALALTIPESLLIRADKVIE